MNIDINEKTLKKAITTGIDKKIRNYVYFGQKVSLPKIKAPEFDLPEPFPFIIENLDYSPVKEFVKEKRNILYIFTADELPGDCKTFEGAKEKIQALNVLNKKERNQNCMPELKNTNWTGNHAYGYCLYVGSCREKANSRIKEHFDKRSKTYGLHLSEWWSRKKPIKMFVLVFKENFNKGYLSWIEDILWETYKPLFGKKGPR
jgi:hypothetical protein